MFSTTFQDVLPWLLQYCHKCTTTTTKSAKEDTVLLLAGLVVTRCVDCKDSKTAQPYKLDFSSYLNG